MVKPKSTFPKIAAECTIKSCNKKKKNMDLKFEGLNFSTGQFERISDWIDSGAKVRVTIQQIDGELDFDEEPKL